MNDFKEVSKEFLSYVWKGFKAVLIVVVGIVGVFY